MGEIGAHEQTVQLALLLEMDLPRDFPITRAAQVTAPAVVDGGRRWDSDPPDNGPNADLCKD